MFDSIITLIEEITVGEDEVGNALKEEKRRNIFAEVRSIGQSEFYQAAQNGLKPEAKFIIADYMDYKNETILEHSGFGDSKPQRYSVIRTYRSKNKLEIVCKRKMGV